MGNKAGDEDSERFSDLIGDVKRLHHDQAELRPPRKSLGRSPKNTRREAPTLNDDYTESSPKPAESYKRGGVQTSVMRKLRRGQFQISAELDLHGLTVAQARSELTRFLFQAQREHVTCVRIVHGKGLGSPGFNAVLRPRVQHWLSGDERVLAYVPAGRRDGGSGATWVLLRRG
ncbi:MAG: Smr/MutS family protein [Gammaproteobacteria bacterium]